MPFPTPEPSGSFSQPILGVLIVLTFIAIFEFLVQQRFRVFDTQREDVDATAMTTIGHPQGAYTLCFLGANDAEHVLPVYEHDLRTARQAVPEVTYGTVVIRAPGRLREKNLHPEV
jgi:hypothetical protein